VPTESGSVLRTPVPGPLFGWAKLASYIELVLFAGLLVVWLAPGFEHATFYFGLAHGIGFIVLALLIWAAVLRHEAPYTLLAATLTPVGPVGSVIAIHYIERKQRSPAYARQSWAVANRGRGREAKGGAGPRRGSRGPPHGEDPL
jgi:hypothetical protein